MAFLNEKWPLWQVVRNVNDWDDNPTLNGDLDTNNKKITNNAGGNLTFEFSNQVNFNDDSTGSPLLVFRLADTGSVLSADSLTHYEHNVFTSYMTYAMSGGAYSMSLTGGGNFSINGTGGATQTLDLNNWGVINLNNFSFDADQTVGASQDSYGLEYVHSAGQIRLTDRTADGWDDITADLGSGKVAGGNQPTWSTFRDGIQAYEFSASLMNELWITFHIKHDYAEGTNVYPHVHWSTTSTATTGVVRWGFEYTVAKGHDQAAFPASTTVYVEYTVSGSKQYRHIISEVADGDAFNAFEADTLVLMRVFRDAAHANDTFTGTVHAFTADIHFQGDRLFTPNKAPPFV